jgi:hypothetical protein
MHLGLVSLVRVDGVSGVNGGVGASGHAIEDPVGGLILGGLHLV